MEHTSDLRSVREGDSVRLTTSEGETFEAECINYDKQYAHPDTHKVRETNIWVFETPRGKVAVNILDGLKSSPDSPDFPKHSELWHLDEDDGMGYIEELN